MISFESNFLSLTEIELKADVCIWNSAVFQYLEKETHGMAFKNVWVLLLSFAFLHFEEYLEDIRFSS